MQLVSSTWQPIPACMQRTSQRAPQRQVLRAPCAAAVDGLARSAQPVRRLNLNLSQDTVLSLPLSQERASALRQAINSLTETLAEKAKATRPKRWPLMEFTVKDLGPEEELEYLEVMSNPNACSSIFEARALITLRTRGGMKLTTETRLPTLQADLDGFLSGQ